MWPQKSREDVKKKHPVSRVFILLFREIRICHYFLYLLGMAVGMGGNQQYHLVSIHYAHRQKAAPASGNLANNRSMAA